ncbi:MAG: CidA/LrgA family protein [Hahellaceae bacterium]|nr:CidA/LrgA family protein [Hahellaceae bacterium]
MIRFVLGFSVILICQFGGEWIHEALSVHLPAPIIGMMLLFLVLHISKKRNFFILSSGKVLLNYLPLFFIPAGAGIALYWDLLQQEFWPIFFAIVLGTPISFVLTLLLFQWLRSLSKS